MTTGRNIATLSCPPDGDGCTTSPIPLPLKIPQVGNLVLSAGPDGTVVGRSDQGCVWVFVVTRTSLELERKVQSCFNHSIGSAYTLTQWSVTVTGQHERETIVGVSHQPNGVDLVTTMAFGSRTKVSGVGGPRAMGRFVGDWTYDPADPETLVNMEVSDGGITPVRGVLRFSSTRYGTVVAHTPDGCQWTLSVRGNTTELDPLTQTCRLADTVRTVWYWAVVSDGSHARFMLGGLTVENGRPSNTYQYIGALTRN